MLHVHRDGTHSKDAFLRISPLFYTVFVVKMFFRPTSHSCEKVHETVDDNSMKRPSNISKQPNCQHVGLCSDRRFRIARSLQWQKNLNSLGSLSKIIDRCAPSKSTEMHAHTHARRHNSLDESLKRTNGKENTTTPSERPSRNHSFSSIIHPNQKMFNQIHSFSVIVAVG